MVRDFAITDEYGYDGDYQYLYEFLDNALNKLKVEGVFSVTLIGDDAMHEMNLKYRGIDRTTDVLSFALNDAKEDFECEVNMLGDIFISIPKMKAQAVEYGHSEKRELAFLTIHGLLHLLGYDHMTPEDERVMFDLQKEVLNDSGITK